MPWRQHDRSQGYLMPPSADELLPEDHPARVVGAFIDSLGKDDWAALGVALVANRLGCPRYHPRALLGIWLCGFMVGLRSSRKLERACREQLPNIWLAGGQRPDYNTLRRFYRAHRGGMHRLLRLTVQLAAELDLVDWSVQAIDGTKIQGDAANRWTLTEEQVVKLERRTTRELERLERAHSPENAAAPWLGDRIADARKLRGRLRMAQQQLRLSTQRYVSLVDADAQLMRRPGGGHVTGYNAQAMSVRLHSTDEESALMLVAADVTQDQTDAGQLTPLVEASQATGSRAELTVADAGYFASGALGECRERGMPVVVPENRRFEDHPFQWRHFRYDAADDSYTYPRDQILHRRQQKYTRRTPAKIYGAEPKVCLACPEFGTCATSRFGRTITISEQAQALEEHRAWMTTAAARDALAKWPALIEPVFAIIKEYQARRRFLLRGLEAVRAEWSLLAVAFNLIAPCKHWKRLRAVMET